MAKIPLHQPVICPNCNRHVFPDRSHICPDCGEPIEWKKTAVA